MQLRFKQSYLAVAALPLLSFCALAQSANPTVAPQQLAVETLTELPDSPGYLVSSSMDDADEQEGQKPDPHAPNAGQKGHTASGEPQQTKRILGIVPNFSSVSANEKLPPLSVKDKFVLAGRNSFDYSSFVLAAVQAGFAMNGASYPEFHQGVAGYARYYWHTLADTADENFMVAGLFPAVLHQDPRFYTLGHGGFRKRALYAASRIFIIRGDGGNEMPNYSEIIGAGAASAVSSLYYPTHYRTWTKVGQKWLTSGLIDSANYTFKEFWPDINHKLFHTH